MNPNIKIAIAEPSAIIRCGLVTLLKRLPGLRIQLTEIATAECLIESLRMHRPEVLMINPALPGYSGIQRLKEECGCPEEMPGPSRIWRPTIPSSGRTMTRLTSTTVRMS